MISSILKGAAWITGAQWMIQLSQFLISIVLARILSPSDYGLVGMCMVYIGFINLFSNLGMGQALIRKTKINNLYISTAFWVTALVATTLFLLSIFFASVVAQFFGDERLTSLIQVAAISLLFIPLNSVLMALLEKRMEFKNLSIVAFAAALVGQLTALAFALSGMGVWSLVIGTIVNNVIQLPLLLRLNKWLPGLEFSPAYFKELFSFGGNILGFNFINYFSRNSDKVIIGRILGPVSLGFYDLAYQIMLKPLQNVSTTISKPLFPALAKIQNDKQASADTYISICVYISIISFPMMMGLATVSPDFIVGVLGEKWAPATPVLQILCIVGAMQSIGTTVGPVYLAQGRSDIMLKWGLVTFPVFALAYWLGTRWGIIGVAFCYGIVSAFLWVLSHRIANGLIGLDPRRFWKPLFRPFLNSAIMAGVVFVLREILVQFGYSELVRLIACVLVGVLVYAVLLFTTNQPEFIKVREFIVKLAKRFKLTTI